MLAKPKAKVAAALRATGHKGVIALTWRANIRTIVNNYYLKMFSILKYINVYLLVKTLFM